ncbi:hypothetical protein J3325_11455 [Leuconostoc mesenteroides]|nr:hypothetical protein [Leuconostoc mesenteroides]
MNQEAATVVDTDVGSLIEDTDSRDLACRAQTPWHFCRSVAAWLAGVITARSNSASWNQPAPSNRALPARNDTPRRYLAR